MAFPFLAAALGLSAVGSLVGSVLNTESQSRTNDTNVDLARETNKTNREIADMTNQANLNLYREQFANNYQQWQESNRYNSPAQQVQRLKSAGLNPSLMMGSGSLGVSQTMSTPSASSAVTGAPAVAPTLQAPQFNFSDVVNSVAALAGSSKDIAESSSVNQDSQLKQALYRTNIEHRMTELEVAKNMVRKGSMEYSLLQSNLDMAKLQYKLSSETFDSQKQSFNLSNQYVSQQLNVLREQAKNFAADTAFKDSSAALNRINANFQPSLLKAAISDTYSQIALRSSQKVLTTNEAAKIYHDAVGAALRNKSDALQMAVYKSTVPYVLNAAKNNNLLQEQSIKSMQAERNLKYGEFFMSPIENMFDVTRKALKEGLSRTGK